MNPTRNAYALPPSAFTIEASKKRAPPERMNRADG
jgi:hypothetical protein